MAQLEFLADLLLGRAQAAGRDARRILDELRAAGELSEDEARELEAAITQAIQESRERFESSVLGPLSQLVSELTARLLGAGTRPASQDSELQERLAALEKRIAQLEEGR